MRALISKVVLAFLLIFSGNIIANDLQVSWDWVISIPAKSHQATIRAAKDIQGFLSQHHGLHLEIVGVATGPGIYLSVNEKMNNDGFSMKANASKQRLSIEASSPRALYQGVLVLEDYLAENPAISESFKENVSYPFKDRYLVWDVNLTGQNKMANGFNLENHIREAVRLGYSGIECNRFLGMELLQQDNPEDSYPWYTYYGASMDQFVSSPLFDGMYPKAYLDRNLNDLKHVVQVVKSFGLKPIFQGYEPRYVPNEFFEKHPELRGPRVDHPLRSITKRYSLCTDREEVLEHYRILAKRLSEEVPGIREMYIIFHDSGAGLCWLSLYSGKNGPQHCKNIPQEERMKKFFGAIQQGFKDGGHDIPVIAQSHNSSRADIDAFLSGTPKEMSITGGNWASWHPTFKDPLGIDLHIIQQSREDGRRTLYYQQHFTGFNLVPTTTETDLVSIAAVKLGGKKGGLVLEEVWKDIDFSIKENKLRPGFAEGLEYASRRTLVRPLVPDAPGLSADERDYWLRYTFSGYQRFGYAHLFRGEGGLPSKEWYALKIERSARSRDVFQKSSHRLQDFLKENPDEARKYPYLIDHERQLRFLGHVYATGACLYEGQALLDKYSSRHISERLKPDVEADVLRFEELVTNEISNTQEFIKFLNEGGNIGMVYLPQKTTYAYSDYLPILLEKKVEIMQHHLPETTEVLNRWFNSEY